MKTYVLVGLLLMSLLLLGCTAPAQENSNVTSSTPAKVTTVPADKLAKIKGALEMYLGAQTSQPVQLNLASSEDRGQYVLLNFTDAQGRPISVPFSSDYQYMYGNVIKVDDFVIQAQQYALGAAKQNQPTPVTKSDKPNMEVFVMSYCPYGLQMEKAVIPVQQLLGNKANISIKFVSYVMHGAREVQENTRQYCIMQNNPDKYWNYLSCFANSGDANACVANQSITESSVLSCMNTSYSRYGLSDSGTQFSIHAAENTRYGVQGSPTVVINGAEVSLSRSPEAVKSALCSAFNTPPAECSTTLSTTQASPGIGNVAVAGSANANCGT